MRMYYKGGAQKEAITQVGANLEKPSQFGLPSATRGHEGGITSNRGSARHGETVPELCNFATIVKATETTRSRLASANPPGEVENLIFNYLRKCCRQTFSHFCHHECAKCPRAPKHSFFGRLYPSSTSLVIARAFKYSLCSTRDEDHFRCYQAEKNMKVMCEECTASIPL